MKTIKKLKEVIFESRFLIYGLIGGATANYVGFTLMTPSALSLAVALLIMALSLVASFYFDYKVFMEKKSK